MLQNLEEPRNSPALPGLRNTGRDGAELLEKAVRKKHPIRYALLRSTTLHVRAFMCTGTRSYIRPRVAGQRPAPPPQHPVYGLSGIYTSVARAVAFGR